MKFEIWLGNDSTHYEHGIAYLDDGRMVELLAYCHIGLVEDAMVIGVADEYKNIHNSIRWYPHPGLIFMSRLYEVDSVLFHNASDHNIYIYGYAYLKPGDSYEYTEENVETHGEYTSRWRPLGIVRMVDTNDRKAKSLIGKYGVLMTRGSQQSPGWLHSRFLLVDYLLDPATQNCCFEASAGLLTYDDEGRAVVKAKHSHYIYDK